MRSRSFQVLLVLLFVCAPVMAAMVDIVDNADGTVTVTVTADGAANIVAAALDIDVDSGAMVTAVSIDTPTFDIFPDAGYDLGAAYTYGAGAPVCVIAAPGCITLPLSNFAVCFANLNGAATPGADGAASVQFTLTIDQYSSFCISENDIRGGIILTDGTGEDINNGADGVVCGEVWPCCHCDCYRWSVPGDYEEAELVGCPDSWCPPYQCRGDADGQNEQIGKGSYAVGYNDIAILLSGFKTAYVDPLTHPWIAADFDHRAEQIGKSTYRVGYSDINILLQYFKNPTVPACNP